MRGLAPGLPAGGAPRRVGAASGRRHCAHRLLAPSNALAQSAVRGLRLRAGIGLPSGNWLPTGEQDTLPYGLIHVQVQLCVLWKPVLEPRAGAERAPRDRVVTAWNHAHVLSTAPGSSALGGFLGKRRGFTVLCHAAS